MALPEPADLLDRLPGGGASLGGAALAAGLLILAVLANQGKNSRTQRRELNRAIEQSVGAAAAVVGRFLSGRELLGAPRSEATFLRPGAPLPDDARTETRLDELGRPSSRVSLTKAAPRSRAVRAVLAPWRVLRSAAAGMWRVLRAWHRWPRAARSAVRLAPLPIAWGLVRHPTETQLVLLAVLLVVLAAALTGPAGMGWWRVAPVWTHGQIYGPGLWVALRQLLRMDDEPRGRWLSVPDDMNADGARIVLRLPAVWVGTPEAAAAIERIVAERVPGEWLPAWHRTGKEHYVEWTPKPRPKPRPVLPDYVPWKPTGDPRTVFLGQAIEGDSIVDALVQTKTATPHWGVAGDTGSGKSTVLYIPVVHGRQNGELIDILDTKRNSLQNAEGYSGVRIHKTTRACVAAFAEFMASMMAAEAAQEKNADPHIGSQLRSRTLVIDELPTLIKLAYSWWRYGLKKRGTPPFLDWLGICLLQGRSSDHRIVVGTQQFANAFFGGTMERAQIGTRLTVGQQDRTSWGVAFGQSTPVLAYDGSIPGRGAYSDKRKDPDADYVYVREIQPCFITPDVGRLLAECPPAPAWFDAGEMAPWITEEHLAEVNAAAATADFLPGGKHGPASLPPAVPGATKAIASAPAAHGVTVALPEESTTAAGTAQPEHQDEELPETYSLAEAHQRGILPWKAATARTYFKRGATRGIEPPGGVSDGQTTYYTEQELTAWLREWRRWQEENKPGARQPS